MGRQSRRALFSPGSSGSGMMAEEFVPGFLLALGAGVLLGAVYDGFRVLRMVLGGGRNQQFVFDLLFMASAALITFVVALAAESGQLRFYQLAGEGIGMCLWGLTFGEMTIWAATLIRTLIQRISKLFRKLYGWLSSCCCRAVGRFSRKRSKKMKNKRGKAKKSLETGRESSV